MSEFLKITADIIFCLTYALTSSYWGRQIQRGKTSAAMVSGLAGLALTPLAMLLIPTKAGFLIAYAINGMTAPAYQVAMFNTMLSIVPPDKRTLNIGAYNTVIELSHFLSPVLGTFLYTSLGAVPALLATLAARALSALLFAYYYYHRKKSPGKPLTEF